MFILSCFKVWHGDNNIMVPLKFMESLFPILKDIYGKVSSKLFYECIGSPLNILVHK